MPPKKPVSLQEHAIPMLKGAAVILDLNCQAVNGCLHSLRKGLIKAGAKLAIDLGPDVVCVISNRSSETAASISEQSALVPMSLTRSSRRRSTQLAQKAILPNITKTDIISKAKRLGTRIVSVDAIMKKLSFKSDSHNKELPPYTPNKVAIQDSEERYRPIVKEFPSGIPKMRTDMPLGQCPFSNKKPSEIVADQSQVAKKASGHGIQRLPAKKRRVAVSGYCEICRIVAADVEEHLASKEHNELVDEKSLWIQVDGCIASLKLLSILDTPKENIHSSIVQHSNNEESAAQG